MQSAAKGGSVRQSAETATVLQRVATNVGNNVCVLQLFQHATYHKTTDFNETAAKR